MHAVHFFFLLFFLYKGEELNQMIVTFMERGDERSAVNDEIRALNYRRRGGSSNGVPGIVDGDLSIGETRHIRD